MGKSLSYALGVIAGILLVFLVYGILMVVTKRRGKCANAQFDERQVDCIFSESFSRDRLGQAIMNRLLKAAGHQVLEV